MTESIGVAAKKTFGQVAIVSSTRYFESDAGSALVLARVEQLQERFQPSNVSSEQHVSTLFVNEQQQQLEPVSGIAHEQFGATLPLTQQHGEQTGNGNASAKQVKPTVRFRSAVMHRLYVRLGTMSISMA